MTWECWTEQALPCCKHLDAMRKTDYMNKYKEMWCWRTFKNEPPLAEYNLRKLSSYLFPWGTTVVRQLFQLKAVRTRIGPSSARTRTRWLFHVCNLLSADGINSDNGPMGRFQLWHEGLGLEAVRAEHQPLWNNQHIVSNRDIGTSGPPIQGTGT